MDAPILIGGFGTDDVKRRLEQCAKQNGYHVAEWLIPSASQPEGNVSLRVVAETKYQGKEVARGFLWNGEDINDLVSRVMALDLTMAVVPQMGARKELPEQRTRH